MQVWDGALGACKSPSPLLRLYGALGVSRRKVAADVDEDLATAGRPSSVSLSRCDRDVARGNSRVEVTHVGSRGHVDQDEIDEAEAVEITHGQGEASRAGSVRVLGLVFGISEEASPFRAHTSRRRTSLEYAGALEVDPERMVVVGAGERLRHVVVHKSEARLRRGIGE